MKRMETTLGCIPALVLGEDAPRAFLFVHGKQGRQSVSQIFALHNTVNDTLFYQKLRSLKAFR